MTVAVTPHEVARVLVTVRNGGTSVTAVCTCGHVTRPARSEPAALDRHAVHAAAELELRAESPNITDPRWQRLRAACCTVTGSLRNGETLDTYVDRVFALIPTMPGAGPTVEGPSADAGQGGQA